MPLLKKLKEDETFRVYSEKEKWLIINSSLVGRDNWINFGNLA